MIKMTIKACSGAKLYAKLRKEPTTELKRACNKGRKELAAKLKEGSLISSC